MLDGIVDLLMGFPGLPGDIIRFFLGPITGVANWVIDLLPNPVNLGITAPNGWIAGYALIETLAPLNLAMTFLLMLTAIEISGGLFRLGERLYHLFPKPFMGT